ncbi:MAG TPA: hypothetical protein VMF51_24710 [Nocardioides sp.]|uniref:hypothetical protein n=1 Tax=Nocardioides sp. TaxID=35761 RepID=UPI002C8DF967|nr:hypothetical protein [Nocardioides sp.]HTW18349.1 hypothetical protein [Nocardioides sp.]
MTTPHSEERPVDLGSVPGEEDIDTADAAERLEQDPKDIDRNREQEPEVATDELG